MAGVNSAGPDFGQWMAVAFGAITGIAEYDPRRSSVRVAKIALHSGIRARIVNGDAPTGSLSGRRAGDVHNSLGSEHKPRRS
jgi:hypothetical protein